MPVDDLDLVAHRCERAEVLGKAKQLRRLEPLIAKDEHLMLDECTAQLALSRVAERLAEVAARDLGPEREGDSAQVDLGAV
jgi:hypothetical protein